MHQIAVSLGVKFNDAKRRFEELQSQGEITGAGYLAKQLIQEVTGHSYQREVESYVLTTDDAKFLVTQYQNKVGRDFSNWIKDKLSDFEKGNDYKLHKIMMPNNTEKIEYSLTMDTAKAICMLERNSRGKAVRKYFIEREKKSFQNQTQRFRVIPIGITIDSDTYLEREVKSYVLDVEVTLSKLIARSSKFY